MILKKLRGLLTLVLACGALGIAARDRSAQRIDSLRTALHNISDDAERSQLAEDISFEFSALNIDSSLHYARLSGMFAEQAGDWKKLAQAHNSIGICFLNKASLVNALDHFQKAYKLYHQIGDRRGEAKMLNNLGVIYSETQNYARAINKFKKSFKINDELGYWQAASNALYNIASNELQLKNIDASLKYAQKVREYHVLHPETISEATLFGDIYAEQGKLDSAEYYVRRAVTEHDKRGDLFYWCTSKITLARILHRQKRHSDAAHELQVAEKAIRDNQFIDALVDLLRLKAEVYQSLGAPSLAYNYARESFSLKDSLDQINQANIINDLNAKYETDRMESQISEQAGIIRNSRVWLTAIIGFAALLVLALVVVIGVLRKNNKLNRLLKAQNVQINRQRQKIVSSINYARKIQQSTLPREHDFKKLFSDSFIYFKPKDIISGDFYAYQKIGEKVYVAAVDCTGHGVPGAFMSLIANAKLNKVVNELGERDPGRILSSMHREIQKALHQESGDEQAQDGVEMSLCCIDLENRSIEFAGAGTSIFIARNGELHEYKGNLSGLGGSDYLWNKGQNSMEFLTQKISYEKNDLLYLFSDGIPDQIGGIDQRKLNKKLFREHLLTLSGQALENAVNTCEQFISDWRKNNHQTDDMMLIGIRL